MAYGRRVMSACAGDESPGAVQATDLKLHACLRPAANATHIRDADYRPSASNDVRLRTGRWVSHRSARQGNPAPDQTGFKNTRSAVPNWGFETTVPVADRLRRRENCSRFRNTRNDLFPVAYAR